MRHPDAGGSLWTRKKIAPAAPRTSLRIYGLFVAKWSEAEEIHEPFGEVRE